MKIYISVDIEGVAGIATPDQTTRGGYGYPLAQRLMTAETNAAIYGAFDAGASEVIVNDSHGTMDNLLVDELDPRATLVMGAPRALCMAEGLTADVDAAVFIGYHGAAGTPGVLAHTFSSHFTELRLNGSPASETDVNALYCATLGVPLALVSGDDVICADVAKRYPGTHTFAVKTAHGWSAVASMAPDRACTELRSAVATSLANPAPGVIKVPERLDVELDLGHASAVDLVSLIPNAERTSTYTVRMSLANVDDLMGFITVAYTLTSVSVASRLRPMFR